MNEGAEVRHHALKYIFSTQGKLTRRPLLTWLLLNSTTDTVLMLDKSEINIDNFRSTGLTFVIGLSQLIVHPPWCN